MRGLLFSRGKYWKFSRQILSPTFSTLKIKMVSNELASCYIISTVCISEDVAINEYKCCYSCGHVFRRSSIGEEYRSIQVSFVYISQIAYELVLILVAYNQGIWFFHHGDYPSNGFWSGDRHSKRRV